MTPTRIDGGRARSDLGGGGAVDAMARRLSYATLSQCAAGALATAFALAFVAARLLATHPALRLVFVTSDRFAGERAAITEFNAGRESRKIGAIHGLKYELPRQDFERAWPEQIYLAHIFDSPDYNTLEACLPAGWAEAHRLSPG